MGGGEARRLCHRGRPGAGPADGAAPVGDRAVHRQRAGLSGAARRTLRTNLRYIARRAVPALDPVTAPLPRQWSRPPCSDTEIAACLALADAQPTLARRCARAG